MSRPTEEVKNHIVKCRIGDRLYDRISGENISEVMRNALESYVTHNNSVTHKSQDNSVTQDSNERIAELEADIKAKQERIRELEFLNDADYVEQLKARIRELEEYTPQDVFINLSFDTEAELRDTLRMVELSSSKDDVPVFLKDLHDRLESGELQIENGRLKLGYSEIFEVLNRAETKKWLKGVWEACETRGRTYQEGLRAVFCEGSKRAVEAIYGDKR